MMRHLLKIIALILLCAGFLQGKNEDRPKFWPIQIKDSFFPEIQLAITSAEQEKGLMNLTSLREDQGMLFVRDQEEICTFWMKNTRIPLDLIFLDRKGIVVKIIQMPVESPQGPKETLSQYHHRLPIYSSDIPVAYALELKAGTANVVPIRVGDQIDIQPEKLQKTLRNMD